MIKGREGVATRGVQSGSTKMSGFSKQLSIVWDAPVPSEPTEQMGDVCSNNPKAFYLNLF